MTEEIPFKEKLKGISFPRKLGATERQPVTNEIDGSNAGWHDVRWDGSQDAHMTPKTLKVKVAQGDDYE